MHATNGLLQKNGASLRTTPGQHAVLQREPKSGMTLAANPLAELNHFSLRPPGEIEITAVGKLGIALVTLDAGAQKVAIEHAFLPAQTTEADAADAILIFGLKPEALVTLNGTELKSVVMLPVDGRKARIVPLKGKLPDSPALVSRYQVVVKEPARTNVAQPRVAFADLHHGRHFRNLAGATRTRND